MSAENDGQVSRVREQAGAAAEHPTSVGNASDPAFSRRASDRTPLGSIINRIERAFAQGDYELTAELLEEDTLAAWFGMHPDRLGEMIGVLRREGKLESGFLTVIAAMLSPAADAGHGKAEQLVADSDEQYAQMGSTELAARVFALRLEGRPVEAMRLSADLGLQAGVLQPLFDTQRGWGLFSALQFGFTAMLAGDFPRALSSLAQARMHTLVPHLPFLTRDAYVKEAVVEALYGDATRARKLLEESTRFPRSEAWAEGLIDAGHSIATSLIDGVTVEEALQLLESVPLHEVGEMWPFYAAAVRRVLLAAGAMEEARRRNEFFERLPLPRREGEGYTGSVLLLGSAADSMVQGDLAGAREQLERADGSIAVTRIALARLELAAGRPREALRQTEGLREQTGGLRALELQRLAMIAASHLALGAPEDSREVLAFALQMPGGFSNQDAQFFSPAVREYAEVGVEGWPTRGTHEPIEDNPFSHTIVPLTTRELDVLRELAGAGSRDEIARSQYISLNTLKAHISSIYRKLGVGSRVAAVLEAERRGII